MNWSELALRVKIIIGVLFVVAVLAAASSIYSWFYNKPTLPQDQYVSAPEIKKAKKIEHKKIIVTSRIDDLKERIVKVSEKQESLTEYQRVANGKVAQISLELGLFQQKCKDRISMHQRATDHVASGGD